MTSTLIILAVAAAVLVWAIGTYNKFITKKNQVDGAWSQIDVQLKRRYDLIPNLVETVKGYAGHEQETLERVIQARNTAMAAPSSDLAQKSVAENALSGTLRQLFALSESYPDLKANENFMELQEELTTTENKISFARQHFNETVGSYNIAIQQVPANIIANFCNFKTRAFFELDAAEAQAVKTAPSVDFSS